MLEARLKITATMIAEEQTKKENLRRIIAYHIEGILGTTAEQAVAIVDAIEQGAVPGVSIKF